MRVQRTSLRLPLTRGPFGGRGIAIALIAALLISVPAITLAAAKEAPSPLVPGLYENFEYVQDAGDVVGMGVFIVWSSNGLRSSFHAVVQTAEGMPGTPVFVTVAVKGADVEFSVPGEDGAATVFKGTVSKKALTGTFGNEKVVLKRVHRGFGW